MVGKTWRTDKSKSESAGDLSAGRRHGHARSRRGAIRIGIVTALVGPQSEMPMSPKKTTPSKRVGQWPRKPDTYTKAI